MTVTRIALCSDTHFWFGCEQRFGNFGSQMQPWSGEIQSVLLAELAAIQPDLILHLGDFSCGGGSFGMTASEFTAVFTKIVEDFRKLPAPFYGVPGNHDSPLGQPWQLAETLLGLPPGQGLTVDMPNARLILLNAQGHDQAQIETALPSDPTFGWVSAAELARLETDLAEAGGRPVVLFAHQLLQRWEGEQPWADLYGIANADEVLAVLSRYGNVRAIFQGHAHRLDVQQFLLGARPCWSVILPPVIEYPMAWVELVLDVDGIQMVMRRLPLRDLAEDSLRAGNTDWRAGLPEWRNVRLGFV